MPPYKIPQVDKEVWLNPVEIDVATQIKHSNVADIVCSLCALREGTWLGAGSSVPVCVEQWKILEGWWGGAGQNAKRHRCKVEMKRYTEVWICCRKSVIIIIIMSFLNIFRDLICLHSWDSDILPLHILLSV